MRQFRWISFFAVLAVLGALAVAVPWKVNLNQQLTQERLSAARSLWRQSGIRDYNLEYLERVDLEPASDRIQVEVRDGKVKEARCNDGPMSEPPQTVDSMFAAMENALRADREAGERNYTVARFDDANGHPSYYVRRLRGSHDRIEWQVRLERVN